MLETTTRSGTVVRTEVLRAPLTAVVTIEGPEVYWEKSYSDPEVSLIIDATDRGYLLSSEIEALIHRATVRLVNRWESSGCLDCYQDGYVPINSDGSFPGVRANYVPWDFRVTPENYALWAEGAVKA